MLRRGDLSPLGATILFPKLPLGLFWGSHPHPPQLSFSICEMGTEITACCGGDADLIHAWGGGVSPMGCWGVWRSLGADAVLLGLRNVLLNSAFPPCQPSLSCRLTLTS